ncbi:MAG: hypothetical protein NT162_00940 [Candidatus Woesebacteria bacterium]|nr:hypothetical protein [Candidatus Woesebacteria bacterium]
MPAYDVFPISKKELQKLYFKNKLSMFQIANNLGCTHSAIVYKFKKFGLKSRGHIGLSKPIKLTKNGFEYLYNERGLSLKKIANMAHCSESGLERRFKNYKMVSRGNKNRTCKYKKKNFSGNLIEKAYLIGFRLGDLNIMESVSVIQVRCSTTIPAQLRLIKSLFVPYTTPHIAKAKRGTYEIVCLVNRSFDFLLPKEDKIPNWIQNNKKYFFSFLAGYSDAEGSFYIRKSKNSTGIFEVQTQQKNVIIQIWKNLQKYKIESPLPSIAKKAGYISPGGGKNNKDMWRISISRKISLWRLLGSLNTYVKHQNKIKDMKRVKLNLQSRISKEVPSNPSPFHLVA